MDYAARSHRREGTCRSQIPPGCERGRESRRSDRDAPATQGSLGGVFTSWKNEVGDALFEPPLREVLTASQIFLKFKVSGYEITSFCLNNAVLFLSQK